MDPLIIGTIGSASGPLLIGGSASGLLDNIFYIIQILSGDDDAYLDSR